MKEEKAIVSKLIDSSIVLGYFFDSMHVALIESEEPLFLSSLSIFEIKKKLLEKKVPASIIKEKMSYLKERMILLHVNEIIAERAADEASTHGIPAMDALIYATSLSNKATVITHDNDFRGLPFVEIV